MPRRERGHSGRGRAEPLGKTQAPVVVITVVSIIACRVVWFIDRNLSRKRDGGEELLHGRGRVVVRLAHGELRNLEDGVIRQAAALVVLDQIEHHIVFKRVGERKDGVRDRYIAAQNLIAIAIAAHIDTLGILTREFIDLGRNAGEGVPVKPS